MLTLAAWGLLDRRLSRRARVAAGAGAARSTARCGGRRRSGPTHSHQVFGGQTRFGGGGDISSSRFGIWSNTLALIASHPWVGVGFGDFNFAWTLTPFPDRPVAFFDHTHNLILKFAVELGVPLARCRPRAACVYALWQRARATRSPTAASRAPAHPGPARRLRDRLPGRRAQHARVPALVRLLPAADGVRVRPVPGAAGRERSGRRARRDERRQRHPAATSLAAMLLILGGTLAVYDYMRVVVIFAPPAGAGPLEQRIADGKKSILFAHHADYAAATVAEHPRHGDDGVRARAALPARRAADDGLGQGARRARRDRQGALRRGAPEGIPQRRRPTSSSPPCGEPRRAPASAARLPFQCRHRPGALRFEDFR